MNFVANWISAFRFSYPFDLVASLEITLFRTYQSLYTFLEITSSSINVIPYEILSALIQLVEKRRNLAPFRGIRGLKTARFLFPARVKSKT